MEQIKLIVDLLVTGRSPPAPVSADLRRDPPASCLDLAAPPFWRSVRQAAGAAQAGAPLQTFPAAGRSSRRRGGGAA